MIINIDKKIDLINKKIHINESQIKKLIKENFSKNLYHFCSYQALAGICQQNAFYLRNSYGSGTADDLHKNKKFYISFTRVKHGSFGYSDFLPVRITLDGEKLQYNYEGKAVDYWGNEQGKEHYYKEKNIDKLQRRTENEDRLFSNSPVIKNANKYITRIDVLLDENADEETMKYIDFIKQFTTRYNINFYTDIASFKIQDNNIVNSRLNIQSASFPKKYRNKMRDANMVSEIAAFVLYGHVGRSDKEIATETAKLLRKYGLDDFISSSIPNVRRILHDSVNLVISQCYNDALKYFASDIDYDTYEKAMAMYGDYMRQHKLSNTKEVYKYKENLMMKHFGREGELIDYNKTQKFYTLVNDYYLEDIKSYKNGVSFGNYGIRIILDPDRTPIRDVQGMDSTVEYMVDELPYHIDYHSSKDDESFTKYLQHIAQPKTTVRQYVDFINSVKFRDESDKRDFMNGYVPMEFTFDYINASKCSFVYDTDGEKLNQMFMKDSLSESKEIIKETMRSWKEEKVIKYANIIHDDIEQCNYQRQNSRKQFMLPSIKRNLSMSLQNGVKVKINYEFPVKEPDCRVEDNIITLQYDKVPSVTEIQTTLYHEIEHIYDFTFQDTHGIQFINNYQRGCLDILYKKYVTGENENTVGFLVENLEDILYYLYNSTERNAFQEAFFDNTEYDDGDDYIQYLKNIINDVENANVDECPMLWIDFGKMFFGNNQNLQRMNNIHDKTTLHGRNMTPQLIKKYFITKTKRILKKLYARYVRNAIKSPIQKIMK